MKKIKWISVEDRLPDNAKDKDALCETVLVFTKYGITQGWFKPGDGWFIIAICLYYRDDEETDIIDFERVIFQFVCLLSPARLLTGCLYPNHQMEDWFKLYHEWEAGHETH